MDSLSHRYDEAMGECRKTLEMDADFLPAHLYLGMTYTQEQMHSEAIDELEKLTRLTMRPTVLGALGYAYGAAGKKVEARRVLRDIEETGEERVFPL